MPPSARRKLNALAYAGIALLAALIFFWAAAVWLSMGIRDADMSQPWTPPPLPPSHGHIPPLVPYSLEDSILEASVVARVRLLSVEEEIRPASGDEYGAYMKFKFEVLEYLKGGYGLNPIWGYVYLDQAEGAAEEEARWKSKYFWERRDSRWDDREAVVLKGDIDKQNRKDHFGLGRFSPYGGESYRAVCEYGNKTWLPAASARDVSGASDEQAYLLEYPNYTRPCDTSDSGKLVSLAELRQFASLSDAKLARRAHSLDGFMYITESPQDLPPETGIYHLSAITRQDRVELSWNHSDSAPNVLGHRILRRKQSDSEFTELADMPVNAAPFYEDTHDIQPETQYIYHLRAYGENGDLADARITITTVAALEPLDAPTATPTPAPTPTSFQRLLGAACGADRRGPFIGGGLAQDVAYG